VLSVLSLQPTTSALAWAGRLAMARSIARHPAAQIQHLADRPPALRQDALLARPWPELLDVGRFAVADATTSPKGATSVQDVENNSCCGLLQKADMD